MLKKTVAVVVPSYERVEMLELLIKSFKIQDYENKILYIFDDSKSDNVEKLLLNYIEDLEIKYIWNEENLWYCENLKKCLFYPKEDIIIVLWDDDIFIDKEAISKYVNVFEENENVGYIYSNQAQIDEFSNVDYANSWENIFFKKWEDSINNLILTSIFIPWMAYRRNIYEESFYPNWTLLFPQLYFTAKIISKYDSFLIWDCLIWWRAHSWQLGFSAIKNENIKWWELHWTLEIIDLVKKWTNEDLNDFDVTTIEKQLINRYSTWILKESLVVWKKSVNETYNAYIKHSNFAKESKKLKIMFFISQYIPYKIILLIRFMFIYSKKIMNYKAYINATNFIKLISNK